MAKTWRVPAREVARVTVYLALLLVSFEVYRAISAGAPRQQALAQSHAAMIIGIERRVGILWEPAMQRRVVGVAPSAGGAALHNLAQYLATRVYKGGQIQWLLGVLLWLYLFQRRCFTRTLLAIISTTMAAVTISALWPVAPPRFALTGAPYFMRDLTGIPPSERMLEHAAGFNPFASLPSVHVLWALLTALGLWYAAPGRAARVATCLFPLATISSVVITGNHYLIDCAASALLIAVYLTLQRLSSRVWAPARAPDTQPAMQSPRNCLVFCACAAWVLLLAGDMLERAAGILVLASGAAAILLTRGQRRRRVNRETRAVDWWCLVLFLAGSTAIDAHQVLSRLVASMLWFVAVSIPLYARTAGSLRPAMHHATVMAAHEPAVAHGMEAAQSAI